MDTRRSPSSPPTVPQVNPEIVTSQRNARLQRLYKDALRATLATNSYANFSSCFPTPARYCPKALEGVWDQLNRRLSEECLKDFEKICQERDIENGLATWERLVEDARARKVQAEEAHDGTILEQARPIHLLSAQELHSAHLNPTLIRVEKELQAKLRATQLSNTEMTTKIEEQRAEIQRLAQQLESIIEDVEGAAKAFEDDSIREELRNNHGAFGTIDNDMNVEG
ncbi:hypothetical protein LTR05_003374 [Lithohypha guttulata]|uniref:Nnf1-domain-containing protein n=1 Tax=Lithohypha guttulata TaxID=1690604 RepID=A0AAN7T4J6_9EURO|nr:hypothetical protein LTR05_003374 [Lithohypha guttulata]